MKYFTWYMKSRQKIDTVRGVDEHENFKSRQWTDRKGAPCYNFWAIDEGHPITAVNYKVREGA
jgi:hypothetical protein